MTPWILAFQLLCGADAASTHVILAHGGHEVWLPTQSPYVVDGIDAAEALSVGHALRQVHTTHPKLAVGLAIGLVVARGFVVGHNLRELAR